MADVIYERDRTDSLAPLWIILSTLAVLALGWLLFRGMADNTATTPNTVNNNTFEAPANPAPAVNIGGGADAGAGTGGTSDAPAAQ